MIVDHEGGDICTTARVPDRLPFAVPLRTETTDLVGKRHQAPLTTRDLPRGVKSREIYCRSRQAPNGTRQMPPAAREKGELVSPVRCRRPPKWVTPNPARHKSRDGGGRLRIRCESPIGRGGGI